MNVKVMRILLGVLLVAASIPLLVEAARDLKEVESEVHPQTFDLIGRALPMPGSGIGTGIGSVPLPGPGSLPGIGSVPIPGIGSGVVFGSMPGIGSGVGIGSFPLPGGGSGAGIGGVNGVGFGSVPVFPSPMDFCAVPSLGCVRVQPINAPPLGGGSNSTPLPFP